VPDTIDQYLIFCSLGMNILPAVLLTSLVLLAAVRWGTRLTAGPALLAGFCVFSLGLVGPWGLALVPALALWLVYWGVRHWRRPQPRRRIAVALLALAAAALTLVPLNFLGVEQTQGSGPPSAGLLPSLTTSLQFLGLGFGQAARHFPYGEGGSPAPPWLGVGVVALALLSVALLAAAWRKQPAERPRVLGLFLFLAGMASLALGLGWARSGEGLDAGYATRYVTPAVPLLCCLYFIWQLYGTPGGRGLIQMGLFTVLCFLFAQNVQETLLAGQEHGSKMRAVERDIRAETPPQHLGLAPQRLSLRRPRRRGKTRGLLPRAAP
jgi:hypothetical protein